MLLIILTEGFSDGSECGKEEKCYIRSMMSLWSGRVPGGSIAAKVAAANR